MIDLETRSAMTELYASYRADPVFFVEHALGNLTWSAQRKILRSVRDNVRTAVRASHSVSKTYSAAEVAVWFLNCFPESKVITTAPTATQMKMLLWSEINALYRRSRLKLEGECLMTMIKTEDPDHFAFGFSTDVPARAEGWHARNLLIVFDEAKGLPQWLWNSIRGALSGGFCRFLAISTTDGIQVGEEFHKIFQPKDSDYNRIHISAYDSPFVTGERFRGIDIPDPERPDIFRQRWVEPKDFPIQLATKDWIDECAKAWGKSSVLYLTKVEGEIVDAGADSIIKLSQVLAMFKNWEDPKYGLAGAEEGGIDVARGGSADTVLYRRKGLRILKSKTITTANLPEQAKLVFICNEAEEFFDRNKDIWIKVDDTGVGGGVTDILQSRGYKIAPVNNGAAAREEDKYPNVASEMWFEVGRDIQEYACEPDDRLMAELVNRKGKLDKRGRRQVEPKEDYIKRFERSPDKADAFLLVCYHGATGPSIGGVDADVSPN